MVVLLYYTLKSILLVLAAVSAPQETAAEWMLDANLIYTRSKWVQAAKKPGVRSLFCVEAFLFSLFVVSLRWSKNNLMCNILICNQGNGFWWTPVLFLVMSDSLQSQYESLKTYFDNIFLGSGLYSPLFLWRKTKSRILRLSFYAVLSIFNIAGS